MNKTPQTLEALGERASDAEDDLVWHEARLPPSMTVKQFIALLDELCSLGVAERTRSSKPTYTIRLDAIRREEGHDILSGDYRASCDPLRTAILRAIGQFHSIAIDLERISKLAHSEAAREEINKTRTSTKDAAMQLHDCLYEPPQK